MFGMSSRRAATIGLPLLRVSRVASSSRFSSTRSAIFHSRRPRSSGVSALHSPSSAARLERTALSTSTADASCTDPSSDPSAGLYAVIVSLPDAST